MNERYSRQILFHEIGKAGQERLLNSRVLLVGCGALGASHAEMLARAGVGHLRIVDRDFVEFTNLTLFSSGNISSISLLNFKLLNKLREYAVEFIKQSM